MPPLPRRRTRRYGPTRSRGRLLDTSRIIPFLAWAICPEKRGRPTMTARAFRARLRSVRSHAQSHAVSHWALASHSRPPLGRPEALPEVLPEALPEVLPEVLAICDAQSRHRQPLGFSRFGHGPAA